MPQGEPRWAHVVSMRYDSMVQIGRKSALTLMSAEVRRVQRLTLLELLPPGAILLPEDFCGYACNRPQSGKTGRQKADHLVANDSYVDDNCLVLLRSLDKRGKTGSGNGSYRAFVPICAVAQL